ncbi:MAG: hypothetical protein IH936_15200 [Acidobacteria bacterium]|nr:hypothetical protein [Acidobacteriota bacterium]
MERTGTVLSGQSPEAAFDRNWAKCLIENCVERLREECDALGKNVQFKVFEARYLRRSSTGTAYRAIAAEFGLSETDVDNYLRWVKPRLQGILMDEVAASTTGSLGDVEEELRALSACLSAT